MYFLPNISIIIYINIYDTYPIKRVRYTKTIGHEINNIENNRYKCLKEKS